MASAIGWSRSNRAMICLLLPICIWALTSVVLFGLPAKVMATSRAFQLFFLLLFASILVRAITCIRQRMAGAAILFTGIILLMMSGLFWYGFSFSGTFELAKGEMFSRYQKIDGPQWGAPPQLPIGLQSAPSQNNGKTVIVVNDRQRELLQDGPLYWKWFAIRSMGEAMAPFLLIDEAVGEEDKAGFVRLPLGKEAPPYFTFGTLPHRIYLSMLESVTKTKDGVTPPTLKVRIMRGKLNVLAKEVRMGELVRFEGHSLRFENGSPWVRLEIRDLRAWYLLISSMVLIVAGGMITAFHRGSKVSTTREEK